jgi:hypothetical protein
MKITKWKSIFKEEEYQQIKVGDHVKGGKFRNKDMEVKSFTTDDKGQPIMKTSKGDKKVYSVRIPTEEDCLK